MKKTTLTVTVLLIAGFSLFLFAGCGGGGGGTPQPSATSAVLTLSTSGSLPANTVIGGVDMTINLPAGALVKTSPIKASIVTYSGIVSVSGVAADTNAMALGTSPSPEQLNVKVTNPNGFGPGEFAKVVCDIAAGSTIAPADFSVATLTAVDLNGAPIQGLSGAVSAAMQ